MYLCSGSVFVPVSVLCRRLYLCSSSAFVHVSVLGRHLYLCSGSALYMLIFWFSCWVSVCAFVQLLYLCSGPAFVQYVGVLLPCASESRWCRARALISHLALDSQVQHDGACIMVTTRMGDRYELGFAPVPRFPRRQILCQLHQSHSD